MPVDVSAETKSAMSKRDIAELACRILALIILTLSIYEILFLPVQLLTALWDLARGWQRSSGLGVALLAASVSSILHLAVVCFLWTRSKWIARKIVPDEELPGHWPHVRVTDLQVAAFSTVGIVAVLHGVWYLSRSIGAYIYGVRGLGGRPDLAEWLTHENSLEALSTLALGIALLIGSRRLVRWLHRWQTAQAQAMDEAETEVGNAPTAEPRA